MEKNTLNELHPEVKKFVDWLQSHPSLGLKEAIASFKQEYPYDSRESILPGWGIESVYELLKEQMPGKTLSEEDAYAVLEKAADKLDANDGVNWEVLLHHIRDLVRQNQIQLIDDPDQLEHESL